MNIFKEWGKQFEMLIIWTPFYPPKINPTTPTDTEMLSSCLPNANTSLMGGIRENPRSISGLEGVGHKIQ